MSTPTTRRHPRTMAEAFPRDHAVAITGYRQPRFARWSAIAGWAGVILLGLMLGKSCTGN